MSNDYIEKRGVYTLQQELNSTRKINPIINCNDKIPLWDGELFIYKDENQSNKNLIYTIPVQVKTRSVSTFKENYYIKKEDLELYKMKNGTIFFVVNINKNDKIKIFYSVLTRFDIEKAFRTVAKNKNIKLELKEFPIGKPGEIYVMCKDAGFLIEKNSSLLKSVVSINDALLKYPGGEINFELNAEKELSATEIVNQIKEQQPYIYYTPSGMDQLFIVDKFSEKLRLMSIQEASVEIKINNEVLFSKLKKMYNGDNSIFLIGDNIKIIQGKNGNGTYSYELKGDLYERINILKFTLNIINGNGFIINNDQIEIDIVASDSEYIKWLKNHLNILQKIKKIVEYFGINKRLQLEDYNELDYYRMEILHDAIFEGRLIDFSEQKDNYYFFEVADVKLILFVEKQSDNTAKIYNFFDYKKVFQLTNTNEFVSNYIIIGYNFPKSNLLNYIDNVNCNNLINEICAVKKDKAYYEIVNSLVLALISFYDINQEEYIIETAEKISDFILSNDDKNIIYELNSYQIKKRMDKLQNNDIEKLTLIKNESIDNSIKFVAAVLLDNINDADYFFDKIDEKNKEQFVGLPIMNLYKVKQNGE